MELRLKKSGRKVKVMLKEAERRRKARISRHLRVRKKISGTTERPRLCVFKSAKHIYAQMIDDTKGITLASASSLCSEFKENMKKGSNIEGAKIVGELLAKQAKAKNIERVVFDRGGYLYHGRVKALAEAIRQTGIVI